MRRARPMPQATPAAPDPQQLADSQTHLDTRHTTPKNKESSTPATTAHGRNAHSIWREGANTQVEIGRQGSSGARGPVRHGKASGGGEALAHRWAFENVTGRK